MAKKTQEELYRLKQDWLSDPCWDIEDTDGFEEHREELEAFHKEQSQKWEKIASDKHDANLKVVAEEFGFELPKHNKAATSILRLLKTVERLESDLGFLMDNSGIRRDRLYENRTSRFK